MRGFLERSSPPRVVSELRTVPRTTHVLTTNLDPIHGRGSQSNLRPTSSLRTHDPTHLRLNLQLHGRPYLLTILSSSPPLPAVVTTLHPHDPTESYDPSTYNPPTAQNTATLQFYWTPALLQSYDKPPSQKQPTVTNSHSQLYLLPTSHRQSNRPMDGSRRPLVLHLPPSCP